MFRPFGPYDPETREFEYIFDESKGTVFHPHSGKTLPFTFENVYQLPQGYPLNPFHFATKETAEVIKAFVLDFVPSGSTVDIVEERLGGPFGYSRAGQAIPLGVQASGPSHVQRHIRIIWNDHVEKLNAGFWAQKIGLFGETEAGKSLVAEIKTLFPQAVHAAEPKKSPKK